MDASFQAGFPRIRKVHGGNSSWQLSGFRIVLSTPPLLHPPRPAHLRCKSRKAHRRPATFTSPIPIPTPGATPPPSAPLSRLVSSSCPLGGGVGRMICASGIARRWTTMGTSRLERLCSNSTRRPCALRGFRTGVGVRRQGEPEDADQEKKLGSRGRPCERFHAGEACRERAFQASGFRCHSC